MMRMPFTKKAPNKGEQPNSENNQGEGEKNIENNPLSQGEGDVDGEKNTNENNEEKVVNKQEKTNAEGDDKVTKKVIILNIFILLLKFL